MPMAEGPIEERSDELPEDLDITAYVGPYVFPNIARRRIPGTMYLALAAACLVGWFVSENGGLLAGAVILGVVAAYHFASRVEPERRPDRGAEVRAARWASPSATPRPSSPGRSA